MCAGALGQHSPAEIPSSDACCCSRFFKMPAIFPAFPCSASCDPCAPGGLVLRHFSLSPSSSNLPDESCLTLVSTSLPLHDSSHAMKTENVLSISINRQVGYSSSSRPSLDKHSLTLERSGARCSHSDSCWWQLARARFRRWRSTDSFSNWHCRCVRSSVRKQPTVSRPHAAARLHLSHRLCAELLYRYAFLWGSLHGLAQAATA
jgi:hypothetical protein